MVPEPVIVGLKKIDLDLIQPPNLIHLMKIVYATYIKTNDEFSHKCVAL